MFGGKSTEYEVSLRSAHSVIRAVDRNLYSLSLIGVTKENEFFLYSGDVDKIPTNEWVNDIHKYPVSFAPGSKNPISYIKDGTVIPLKADVIFPIMHGKFCEDGRLQGLLELLGIPFVGPDCTASAVCMDKTITKLILQNYGIPQAKAKFLDREHIANELDKIICDIEKEFTYPVFVKPSSTGSSVGASKAKDRDALKAAIVNAAKYDRKVLVEEFINAREVEIAVMGTGERARASIPGEIDPGNTFYDYDTKYKSDTASYYIPARISEKTSKEIRELALKIYRILGCKNLSRVDFFVEPETEKIIFNEINTLPGFTIISMFPKLFKSEGMTYAEICDELCRDAIDNKTEA